MRRRISKRRPGTPAISKTNDNGSGCSADGNLVVHESIYDKFLEQLQKEGGYLCSDAGEGTGPESVVG